MSHNSNDSEEDGEIDREETRYNLYSHSQPTGKVPPEQADDSDSYDTEDGSEDTLNIQPPQAAISIPKRERRDRKRDKHSRKHESSRSRKDRRHASRERGGGHRDGHRGAESRGGHSREQRDAYERDLSRHRVHRTEEKTARNETRVRGTADKDARASEKEQRMGRESGRSSGRQETKEPPTREMRDARERIREAREAREREREEREQERLQREWRKERLMVVDQSLVQRDRERDQRRQEMKRHESNKPQQYAIKANEQMTSTIRDRSRSPMSRSKQNDDQSSSDPGISLEIEDDPLTDMEDEGHSPPQPQHAMQHREENNVARAHQENEASSDNEEDTDKSSSETSSESSSDSDDSSSSTDSEDDEDVKGTEEEKIDGPIEVKSPQQTDQEPVTKSTAAVEEPPKPSVDDILSQFPPYLPAIQGCRSVEEFHCLNRIEEGTYGVVYRARDKQTNEIVALKRLKMEKEKEGFPITSLREINTLLKAQHPNIVTVREIVVGSNMDKIYIAMDYVEHDLKSLMEVMKQPFLVGEVKTLMLQLLRAVAHLHDNWILHRDLKTSNLLLSHKGILKVGDFGLAREYGSPLKHYTPIVVTLWYRAPELLLGVKEYSTPIDMWSVGCIFGELLSMKPLFPGKSDIDQLNRIFKDLGTPSEKIWPGYLELPLVRKVTFTEYPYNSLRSRFAHTLSNLGFDLLNKFLTYYPSQRITAEDALRHEFFKETPVPVEPSMFPTWPAKSELGHRKAQSPKPPSGGKQFAKQLGEGDEEGLLAAAAGFHMKIPSKGSSAQGTGFRLKF